MSAPSGTFLMNCWYVAAWDHELVDGALLERTILEEPVVIFKGESGQAIALDNRCAHRGAKLSRGRLEGDCLRCMYHGLKFDASGKCVQIPGQDRIPEKLGVRSYPVVERGHLVWIWMGDPALADEDKLLDIEFLEDPAWRGLPGYMHYASNYLLIVDNLADFSHLAFVHTKSLGGSEEYAYKTKHVEIERLERGFKVERWNKNSAPPPYHRRVVPGDEPVDRLNVAVMHVPGIFIMETSFTPAGSNRAPDELREYRNCQFFTPETRKTTHFFWNYLHNKDIHDGNVTLSLYNSMVEGFMEDKVIIEDQQVILDQDDGFQMQGIAADVPLAHFRRTLDRMIAAELQGVESASAG
jgi:vanillate O-demethylase monooxygenase subunit